MQIKFLDRLAFGTRVAIDSKKKHIVWIYPNHVYTWFRRPGPRVLNAYFFGPVSLVDEKVLRAANRNTSTYATENILTL